MQNKSIQITCDAELIRGILSRDNIYDTLVYDGSPSLNQYVPRGIWIQLLEGDMIAGLINLEPMNNVMWNTHVFIFEKYRGNDSYIWGKLGAEFMKNEMGAKKLLGFTPYNSAMKYSEKVGFEFVRTLSYSIVKNGDLLSQYMMEMSL